MSIRYTKETSAGSLLGVLVMFTLISGCGQNTRERALSTLDTPVSGDVENVAYTAHLSQLGVVDYSTLASANFCQSLQLVDFQYIESDREELYYSTPLVLAQGPSESSGDLDVEASIPAEDEEEVNSGQDFAKPLARLDLRSKIRQQGDVDTLFLTFRVDAPFKLDNGWKLSTRFDLPTRYVDTPSRDNPNGDWEFGMGDMLAQVQFITPEKNRWAAGVGLRTILPTATQDQFGSGKYQLVPQIGVVHYPDWLPDGSYLACILQDFFSVAGDDDRADIHELEIKPSLNIALGDSSGHWFVNFAPEARVNWEDNNRWHVPFNMIIGRKIGKKFVVSLEWNQTIVDNYDRYDWELEFRIGIFFERGKPRKILYKLGEGLEHR